MRRTTNEKRVLQVDVTMDDVNVMVTPPCVDVLMPVLTSREFKTVADDDGRLHVTESVQPFFHLEDGALVASVGLTHRIIGCLAAAGKKVRLADQRQGNFRQHDQTVALQAYREDRRLLDTVASNPRGQLIVHGGNEQIAAAGLLHRFFPHGKTLVIVPGLADARRMKHRLEQYLDRAVGILDAGRQLRYRIYVASHRRFQYSLGVQDGWGRFLYVGVPAATGAAALHTYEYLFGAYHYAIVTRHERRTSDDLLRLEAVTGPEIFRQATSWSHLPAVAVEWANPPSVPLDIRRLNPLQRKQCALWSNNRRNQYIADMAVAFSVTNVPKLYELGLLLNRPPDVLQDYNGRMRVAILAESVQHAQVLHALLPHWELRTAVPELQPEGSVTNWQIAYAERAIVTMGFADRYGINAEVVVRADGTNTAWQEAWGPHPSPYERNDTMFVVDLKDDYDEAAQRHRAERQQQYEERGWGEQRHETP